MRLEPPASGRFGQPGAAGVSGSPGWKALGATPTTPTSPTTAPPLPRPEPITELPILVLFPHSRCNCRCLMCDIWRDGRRQELGTAEVAAWAAEWQGLGVRQVALSGGEALLHGDLWNLCEALRDAGIAITLLTTGLLLRRDARQVARHCAEVIVSLDGPREVHDEIRNLPRAYDKLAAGIAALRDAAGRDLPIGARSTVQRLNFRYLRATVAAAHDDLGVDWLSFLAADVSSEAFNRAQPWDGAKVATVALAADDLPALAAELSALARERGAEFAAGFLRESPAKLNRRLLGYYRALHGRGDFPPNRCNAPWISAVVEADGTVRPCFFQPPLGNLRQAGSLAAILNSPAALDWRRQLDVATDPICRRCVCTLAHAAPPGDLGKPDDPGHRGEPGDSRDRGGWRDPGDSHDAAAPPARTVR